MEHLVDSLIMRLSFFYTYSDFVSKYVLTLCQNGANIPIKELTQCQK